MQKYPDLYERLEAVANEYSVAFCHEGIEATSLFIDFYRAIVCQVVEYQDDCRVLVEGA